MFLKQYRVTIRLGRNKYHEFITELSPQIPFHKEYITAWCYIYVSNTEYCNKDMSQANINITISDFDNYPEKINQWNETLPCETIDQVG